MAEDVEEDFVDFDASEPIVFRPGTVKCERPLVDLLRKIISLLIKWAKANPFSKDGNDDHTGLLILVYAPPTFRQLGNRALSSCDSVRRAGTLWEEDMVFRGLFVPPTRRAGSN